MDYTVFAFCSFVLPVCFSSFHDLSFFVNDDYLYIARDYTSREFLIFLHTILNHYNHWGFYTENYSYYNKVGLFQEID